MKKTNTRLFATLGVVAGLGLAFTPAFSYAADVSGDVQIETEIIPSLAMRIHSNADGTGNYGVIKYNPASAQSATDPEPTAANVASQATGLSLSANQADGTTLYSDIEIRSNTGQFKLEVADTDTDTALRNATTSTATNEFIPAGISTTTDANSGDLIVDPTVAGWGLMGGDIDSWTAIPASTATPLTIEAHGVNSTSPLAYSNAITVNYVVASGSTKTDTYGDTITYTATAMDANSRSSRSASSATAGCGQNEGDTCTIDGVDYQRLRDGKLWTVNPVSGSLWTVNPDVTNVHTADEQVRTACSNINANLPTAQDFHDLMDFYGGDDDTANWAAPYGTKSTGSQFYEATGYLGGFWTSTEYDDDLR